MSPTVAIRAGDISIAGLPLDLADAIKVSLTGDNPAFLEAERAGRWTGNLEPEVRWPTILRSLAPQRLHSPGFTSVPFSFAL